MYGESKVPTFYTTNVFEYKPNIFEYRIICSTLYRCSLIDRAWLVRGRSSGTIARHTSLPPWMPVPRFFRPIGLVSDRISAEKFSMSLFARASMPTCCPWCWLMRVYALCYSRWLQWIRKTQQIGLLLGCLWEVLGRYIRRRLVNPEYRPVVRWTTSDALPNVSRA